MPEQDTVTTTEAIRYKLPPTEELEAGVSLLVEQAQKFAIVTREDAELVSARVKGLAERRKIITEHHEPMRKAFDDGKKVVLAQRDKLIAPLDSAEAIYKSKYAEWYKVEEEKRRQENLRLEAEARKREDDRRLAEAAALQRAGRREEAEEVLEEPPPDIVCRKLEPVAVKGLSPTETWKCRVIDLHKFICTVAADPSFVNLLSPSLTEMNALARATKGAIKLPGLEFFKEVSVSRR